MRERPADNLTKQNWRICVPVPHCGVRASAARIRQLAIQGWISVLSHVYLTALLITNGDTDFCIRMRRQNSLTSA